MGLALEQRVRCRATTPPPGYRATGTGQRRCCRGRPADPKAEAPRLRRRLRRRPTRSWASSRASAASASPVITTITRLGCSWLAALAASMDSSSRASLSGAMTNVNTRPEGDSAGLLAQFVELLVDRRWCWCRAGRRSCAAPPSLRSASSPAGSRSPPFPAGPAQHLERRRRAPGACFVGIGFAVFGPVVERGIQYLPSQFDFGVDREQRRLAE